MATKQLDISERVIDGGTVTVNSITAEITSTQLAVSSDFVFDDADSDSLNNPFFSLIIGSEQVSSVRMGFGSETSVGIDTAESKYTDGDRISVAFGSFTVDITDIVDTSQLVEEQFLFLTDATTGSEPGSIVATVENRGDRSGTATVDVSKGTTGVIASSGPIGVSAGLTKSVFVSSDLLSNGDTANVILEGSNVADGQFITLNDVQWDTDTGDVSITSCNLSTDTVTKDNLLGADVSVENTYDSTADVAVTAYADGTEVSSVTESVAGGTTSDISLTLKEAGVDPSDVGLVSGDSNIEMLLDRVTVQSVSTDRYRTGPP